MTRLLSIPLLVPSSSTLKDMSAPPPTDRNPHHHAHARERVAADAVPAARVPVPHDVLGTATTTTAAAPTATTTTTTSSSTMPVPIHDHGPVLCAYGVAASPPTPMPTPPPAPAPAPVPASTTTSSPGPDASLYDRAVALHARCAALLPPLAAFEPATALENGGCSWTAHDGGRTSVWPYPSAARRPIEGLHSLDRTIRAELRFLESLLRNPDRIRESHVTATNVLQLEVVVQTLVAEPAPVAVMKTFVYYDPCPICAEGDVCTCAPEARREREHSVKVDLVADHGAKWLKLRARNERGVEYEFLDDPHYVSESDDSDSDSNDGNSDLESEFAELASASRSIRDHFAHYARAAAAHPVHYTPPRVVIRFCHLETPDPRVVALLESAGLQVEGAAAHATVPHPVPAPLPPLQPVLNLDGSTLIALTSDLAHTHTMTSRTASSQAAFAAQLDAEQATPLLAPLVAVLARADRLVVTQVALDHFRDVAAVVAGPTERLRVQFLFPSLLPDAAHADPSAVAAAAGILARLPRIHVVPDAMAPVFTQIQAKLDAHGEARNAAVAAASGTGGRGSKVPPLYVNGRRPGKLKWLHAQVFGTGHGVRATTVTANLALVRSLQELGVPLSVWVHQPRSLTERKDLMLVAAGREEGRGESP
ncbi:hypothetical protein GGF31_006680 [Allomyces arbusculus]|nr:hypothetical protein GGF31_006680 [Allomyces arbusculus]